MKRIAFLKQLIALLLSPMLLLAAEERKEIPLWPNDAPGSEGKSAPEAVRIAPAGDHVVSSVHRPSLTPYLLVESSDISRIDRTDLLAILPP